MKALVLTVSLAAMTSLALSASAQSEEHWDKTYTVAGQPDLTLKTGDSNLAIKSCGACQTVRIHIDSPKRKLSDYRIEEEQSGDRIHFSLKEKPHIGVRVRVSWHGEPVSVQVETPANLTLHAETADGNLDASGLNGTISLHSSDGRQTVADVSGSLHIQSSDGGAELRNISGTVDAHASDGDLNISGKLDGLNVSTSDGKVSLELASGSTLKNDSTVHSSDGTVTVRLPKDFSINLDVSTSDGKIDCNLPLTLDGFHSNGGSDHSVRGKLNGGGSLLSIHTSDGTVHLSSL
ncbi:hypothetical protein ACPOL_1169 [Acidisarcina polymorpha]|uniref:DUF4097 domain-containing protein n=1 Tax=Acidisarcina polymorpha TaxID=2211140 RepID=A0A2Z5FVI3_9BACT|nr:DUF4097 family beta strand repeat-containing protein [Acidisarcina polymorpha]AXC10517.1 hypothetical protein ACPOL_1169 [Acidisarcina polymorpha]